jgi:uridylate kinase
MQKYRFIVVTGGGITARKYIEAAKQFGIANQESLDWIGIAATKLNERLITVALNIRF